MKTFFIYCVMVVLSLSVVACGGMPKHAQSRHNDQPTLVLLSAPLGAEVLIDGQRAGVINDEERQSFPLHTGRQHVQVKTRGAVLFEQELFVQDSTQREIDLSKLPR